MGAFTNTQDQVFFDVDNSNFFAKLDGMQEKLMARVEKAMYGGGAIIARDARLNLNRNRSVITGDLKGSITVQVKSYKDYVEVLIGTKLAYARRVEYGFYDRTDVLGRHFMQAAKPYLRPAFEHKKIDAMTYIAAHVKAAVDESTDGRGVSGLADTNYYGEDVTYDQ